MEEREIINLWKSQEVKIEQSLSLNRRLLEEMIKQKAQNVLRKLRRFKIGGILAAVIYLMLLGIILSYAIFNYSPAANYFIISIGTIFLINVKALADYIKHLIWINNINFDGSITEVQNKLVRLTLSIYAHNRIVVLQFPFWTTFFLSNKWFPQSVGWGYITFQIIFTLSFTYLAYWLYKNQTPKNAHKKWVRILNNGSGGKSVTKALEFYKEIEEFGKTV